jgi:hypothetical protein
MMKHRIRKKTKRKTQKKTRSNSKSKTQRKTYRFRLRNKSKRKKGKRGGARTTQNEKKKTEGVTPQQQVTSLVNRTANLPRHLQHNILHSSHPSVATGMYTNSPQRQGLNRRIAQWRRFGQGVRNRQINQRMRTRVALPGYPIGSLMTDDDITGLRFYDGLTWPLDNAPAQNKEMKRLITQQYLGFLLSQNEIFGSGPFNSKTAVAHVGTHAQRKQQRQALLAMGNDINDRRINNELLPLPLQIVRTIRRHDSIISDRYPRNPDGTIDETNDIFWPRNKREFYLFMINIPSFDDILFAVDVCLLDDDGF